MRWESIALTSIHTHRKTILAATTVRATYTAVYEKTPLPQKNEENEASFFTLYLIAVYRNRGIVLVSLATSLASVIGFVLYKKYRKKHPIS